MDAPASPLLDAIERIALVGLGAASLTADRVEELADALADRGLNRREDVRDVIEELRGRWRNEAERLGGRAGGSLQGVLSGLGLGGAARDVRVDELELRLAQLEHRLRLVEAGGPAGAPEGRGATDRPS
jgi:polyhydroxyalkanoate synthesis regulator phasin